MNEWFLGGPAREEEAVKISLWKWEDWGPEFPYRGFWMKGPLYEVV